MPVTGGDHDQLGELIKAVRDTEQVLDEISDKLRTSRIVQRVLGGVVVVVVLVVLALGHVVLDARDAAVAGCERGNALRADVLVAFDQNDQDFAEALAEVTGATPERLAEFLAVLRSSREVPEALLPVDCEALY